MGVKEKTGKIASNIQKILLLEKENEELDEMVNTTRFKVKVESVAFGYKLVKRNDIVSVYDFTGSYIKLQHDGDWKMFSYSELIVLFEEMEQ